METFCYITLLTLIYMRNTATCRQVFFLRARPLADGVVWLESLEIIHVLKPAGHPK